MTKTQRNIFILLLVIAAAAFVLFGFPNAANSQNLSMVQSFQPDEAAVLPYIFRMIAPAPSLVQALKQFIFYEYYFYGFPFFAASALVLLPLQWLGRLGEMPLVMLILRQFISVLPMLLALLLLVYMQDEFRTYRSPVLFVFLLAIPAVVANNTWFHPDGITFLLVVLVIYLLKRDNLRLGWNFLLAAVLCGVAASIKLIGEYFFLAVGLVLALSLFTKKASWKKLAGMASAFIVVMVVAYLLTNPFLFSHWGLTEYLNIIVKEGFLLENGYGVFYPKGLAASWPLVHNYYGELSFLLVALGVAIWGAWRGPKRLLHGLILAWFLPLSFTVFFLTHFKFQYWLPVVLPLISCLVVVLPERWNARDDPRLVRIGRIILVVALLLQFGLFANKDAHTYVSLLHHQENSTHIKFYDVVLSQLAPLPDNNLSVYYDYRLYVPGKPGWRPQTTFDLLEYDYIRQSQFDVLLLLEQRIRDYLNPNVTGIDAAQFTQNQQFYRDADNGTVQGYHLIYRDQEGLIYVRDALYQEYYLK